ncbi:terminase (plasmid) [Borrelia miyamotoi]|uniref:Terminase n=2 Tax=Borrelia miyamotoi TaxID=47466 RepID=A0AAQ3CMX1_9SPIR|nr:hypothetical protein [Borrelia miyamotoi]MBW6184812.1 hypothetical protein [Pseudomonas aeruginosa]AHH05809.1 Hypothetical protein BOM_1266 [Borrelia miyamotoi FR64b]ATQ15460.1 terminase [Borrelia miyamotoi]ATQ16659.1 terminase [Borrelia miyamotoi]ATQ17891.1 terminase [Borrelia miyamotoi]
MKNEQLISSVDESSSSSGTSSEANNVSSNKEFVTISCDEYEKLISDSKKLPDMISKEDFERRLAEVESNFTKARKQAEKQAEVDAFKDSKLLAHLEKACEQYEITPPFANASSIKDAKLAFLDAMKKKYSIKFRVDESGDLDSQIENISLLVQELTAYKQMVNARNRYVGQIINNTKAQRYKERLVTREVVNA